MLEYLSVGVQKLTLATSAQKESTGRSQAGPGIGEKVGLELRSGWSVGQRSVGFQFSALGQEGMVISGLTWDSAALPLRLDFLEEDWGVFKGSVQGLDSVPSTTNPLPQTKPIEFLEQRAGWVSLSIALRGCPL